MAWLATTAGIAVALVGGPATASAKAPTPEPPVATAAGICDANLWRSGKVKKTTIIALGGTSYAVATIGTKQIKNNAVRSVDVRNGTIISRDVEAWRAGRVGRKGIVPGHRPEGRPRRGKERIAADAAVPGPVMRPNMDSCIEPTPRPALAWGLARVACEVAKRRLPSYQELASWVQEASGGLAPGGELTANVYPPQAANETVRALIIVSPGGSVDTVPDTFAGGKGFRCVANPVNG